MLQQYFISTKCEYITRGEGGKMKYKKIIAIGALSLLGCMNPTYSKTAQFCGYVVEAGMKDGIGMIEVANLLIFMLRIQTLVNLVLKVFK